MPKTPLANITISIAGKEIKVTQKEIPIIEKANDFTGNELGLGLISPKNLSGINRELKIRGLIWNPLQTVEIGSLKMHVCEIDFCTPTCGAHL